MVFEKAELRFDADFRSFLNEVFLLLNEMRMVLRSEGDSFTLSITRLGAQVRVYLLHHNLTRRKLLLFFLLHILFVSSPITAVGQVTNPLDHLSRLELLIIYTVKNYFHIFKKKLITVQN